MNKRLGFFGGCFNPPTIAHISFIEKAISEANLDKVYFVPMTNSYEKEGLIEQKHRINMIKLAICKNKKIDVLILEEFDNKRNYAIESFKLINDIFKNSENFFIMGSDNYEKIGKWNNSKELFEKYNYIILDRNNLDYKNVIVIKDDKKINQISSSLIREKIKNNENVDYLVTEDVKKYILENKLYN